MTHSWYNGCLLSSRKIKLTRVALGWDWELGAGGRRRGEAGSSCLSDANISRALAVITRAVISWNRTPATPGHARLPPRGGGCKGWGGVHI